MQFLGAFNGQVYQGCFHIKKALLGFEWHVAFCRFLSVAPVGFL